MGTRVFKESIKDIFNDDTLVDNSLQLIISF